MNISPISMGMSANYGQVKSSQAAMQILQAADTMLLEQASAIAQTAMDTVLGEMLESASAIGRNVDMYI